MGLIDKIKAFFAGPAVKNLSNKLAELAEKEIVRRAMDKIKEDSEEAAKEKLAEVVSDVLKEQLTQIPDPTGLAVKFGSQIIDDAAPKVTDKVWDKVKDKIVKKKGEGTGTPPAAAGYGS